MLNRSNYRIVENDFRMEKPLVIEDLGPWSSFLTITNDAEAVVEELANRGELPDGRRLIYIDSEGRRDEILIQHGRFAGFKAWNGPEAIIGPITVLCPECGEVAVDVMTREFADSLVKVHRLARSHEAVIGGSECQRK